MTGYARSARKSENATGTHRAITRQKEKRTTNPLAPRKERKMSKRTILREKTRSRSLPNSREKHTALMLQMQRRAHIGITMTSKSSARFCKNIFKKYIISHLPAMVCKATLLVLAAFATLALCSPYGGLAVLSSCDAEDDSQLWRYNATLKSLYSSPASHSFHVPWRFT